MHVALPIGLLLLMMPPTLGANPAAEPDRARDLVRALGGRDYRAREQAAHDLIALGRSAYPALVRGASDQNAEVRARCRRLLPIIFDLELKARVEAFIADADGSKDQTLPGWDRFRKLAGDTRPARDLFVGMVRADGRLMDAIENRPNESGIDKLQVRCMQMQQRLYPREQAPTQAEVGQLLFLGANPDLAVTQQACVQINQFLYRPEVRGWFTAGEQAPLMKALLLAWLRKNIEEPNTGYMIANLLSTLQLKEISELALDVVLNKRATPQVRGSVLTSLGRLAYKEMVPKIQPLITDETMVSQFVINRVRGTTQLGDVVLAMSIHLSGQSPGDYGFEGLKATPTAIYSYYRLGFENQDKRDAARKKWQEWLEKQKR